MASPTPGPISRATSTAEAQAEAASRPQGLALTTTSDLIGPVDVLGADDIADYLDDGPGGLPEIQRVSTRHHRMAQLVARGERPTTVARAFSCTPATVTRLMKSPAFAALVEHYQSEMVDRDQVIHEKMLDSFEEGVELLGERIASKAIDNPTLVKAISDLGNRTGFSEQKNVLVKQGGIDEHELDEMKRRARRAEGHVVVDATFTVGEDTE